MDKMDVGFIEKESYGGSTEIAIFAKTASNTRARFAMALLEKLALAMAEPDREDSAGRQRFRLMDVASLVDRACNIADTACNEFEARGWVLELPAPQPTTKD